MYIIYQFLLGLAEFASSLAISITFYLSYYYLVRSKIKKIYLLHETINPTVIREKKKKKDKIILNYAYKNQIIFKQINVKFS